MDLLDRAIAALPDGVGQVRCRWDAGYFAEALARACIERGVQFAIGVKRTAPVLAAPAAVPEHQWVPAIGMEHTKIALIDYRPGSLPTEGVRCIAWRTRIPVARIPTARARKRRAIPQEAADLAP